MMEVCFLLFFNIYAKSNDMELGVCTFYDGWQHQTEKGNPITALSIFDFVTFVFENRRGRR
jgi:hypothetical protein